MRPGGSGTSPNTSDRWLWPLGVLVRLLLMPLFFHGDQVFIQYFPWHASYGGHWDVYGHLMGTFLNKGFTYYPPLVLWITAVWQVMTQPLMAGFDGWMMQADGLMRLGGAAAITDFIEGQRLRDIVRWVFIGKLLYLFADVLCWRTIRAVSRRDPGLRGLERLWVFHPVLLFSVYIFGQYRILPALVIWVVFGLIQQDRKKLAAVTLGCLLLLDNFGWLILLPTMLVWGKGILERAQLFITSLLIPAVVLVPWAVVSKGYVLTCYYSPTVQRMSLQGIFRGLTPEGAMLLKLVFAGFWLVAVVAAWRTSARSPEERAILWAASSSAVLLALYATSTAMIHYFMWILPFWIIVQVKRAPQYRHLASSLVILLLLFNLDSREMNLGLMAHLHPSILSVPSAHEIMGRWLPWGKAVALARLAFTVLCLYFAFANLRILHLNRAAKRIKP
jgi:hypothetical protein